MAEFYSARSATITPLPWQSFAPPFSESQFRVDVRDEPFIDVSLRGLPRQPTIVVMPPRLLGVEAP